MNTVTILICMVSIAISSYSIGRHQGFWQGYGSWKSARKADQP